MATQRFCIPTEIVQDVGCFAQLGTVAKRYGERALLVCGRHAMRASGALERAQTLLQQAGMTVCLYDRVSGEPVLALVEEARALARTEQCHVIVGLGGGSAMDVAKAVAGLLPLSGSVAEYHAGRRLEGPGVPFIAVPTTAGTGAEVSNNAVLTDPVRGIKTSIRSDGWYARVALVDPELTLGVPPGVTAASGADALCQAIEAYVSIGAMPITDALCQEAIRLIGRSLRRAYAHGDDLAARSDMLYGSLMAGMSLTTARLGAVHGMAHPLGYRYNIPHGVVCGLLLPYVMAYNADYAVGKYARVAELLGVDARGRNEREMAQHAAESVRELMREIGIPLHLRPFGVSQADWPAIVAESLASSSLRHNPRPFQEADVQAILEEAM